jgi:DNA-directed RNA polymerase specialized sigma24 family protein
MLGVPEGTIKTNLHRARALLLERIRALGLADPALWLEKLA